MLDFFKRNRIKKEVSGHLVCDPGLLDMAQIVARILEYNLSDNSDLFEIYKEILRITSKETVQIIHYFAKGLPLWLADVPSTYKVLYLRIVKQSLLKTTSNMNLFAETLPSLLLKVDEKYRKFYLDTLLLSAHQKMFIEQKMAKVLSDSLRKIEDTLVNDYFQLIHTAVIQDPLVGLKIAQRFIKWAEKVSPDNLALFLTCIGESIYIDPGVGKQEAEILSRTIDKWHEDNIIIYHTAVMDITKKFPPAGKSAAIYVPKLIEEGAPSEIALYQNNLSDIMECNFYLGQTAAKHLPDLLIHNKKWADHYKSVILAIASENLNTAISAADVLPLLLYLNDNTLVDLYTDIIMDVIRQPDDIQCFQAKILAEKLPKQISKVTEHQRKDYLELIHKIAQHDKALTQSAIEILPHLFSSMSLHHVCQFVDKGLGILKQDKDKAIAFFSLTSKMAHDKVALLKSGIALTEVAHTLRLYATAHGGRELHIRASQDSSSPNDTMKRSYTDGATIYLPDEIDRYREKTLNFKFYKLITALEASKIEFGTYNFTIKRFYSQYHPMLTKAYLISLNKQSDPTIPDLYRFFNSFAFPVLSLDLFKIFEFGRVMYLLFKTYKGLNREAHPLLLEIFNERPSIDGLRPVEAIIEILLQLVYWGRTRDLPDDIRIKHLVETIYNKYKEVLSRKACDVYHSAYLTWESYNIIVDEYSAKGYDTIKDVYEKGEDEDFTYLPNAIQEVDTLNTEIDDTFLPEEDTHEQSSEKTEDNVIKDFHPDASKDAPLGIEEDASDTLDFQDYNSFEELPFQGDLRADLVQQKQIELIQAVNTLKKEIDDTDNDALKKEINDMLKQQDIAGQTVDTDEILPLIKGKNFERLLTGFREKDVPLKDFLEERGPGNSDETILAGENIYYYDEWDSIIRDYKLKWTTVHEKASDQRSPDIVLTILNNNKNIISAVKSRFERLSLEGLKKLKRQFDGDDLDIDAVTEAIIDIRTKNIPSDRLYIRKDQRERDVSVAFLVDLSNSTSKKIDTHGKTILDVERESLVIMAEALESIGDKYAIYGFSGRGRHHCTFYIFKDFSQPYNDMTRELIGGMIPLTSTRLGPALRHSILKLKHQDSKSKLLFLLTDGKPVDNDNYDDQYAWGDTKMALKEAKNVNIHPFCITIDDELKKNYDNVYGNVHHMVIKDVASLPVRLPTIYHKITRP